MNTGKNLQLLLLQLLNGIEDQENLVIEGENKERLDSKIMDKLNELFVVNDKLLKSIKLSSKEILSLTECSEYLNISKSLLYKKTSKKELPFYKFGGVIYFNKSEIKDFILANPQK